MKRGECAPRSRSSSPTFSRRWTRSPSRDDPNLLAAGFISYEAGVWIEGSTALVRPHDFLPFAEFFVFDTRRVPTARIAPPPPAASPSFTLEESASAQRSLSSAEWESGVGAIRDGIARGDVYQVNLSHRTRFSARVEPFALARELFAGNPVPFAVTLATERWAVVSNSPELFLDIDLRGGRAVTKPIKGTAARGATPEADAEARAGLLASAKDRGRERHDHGPPAQRPRPRRLAGRRRDDGCSPSSARSATSTTSNPPSRRGSRLGRALSDVLCATLPGGSITGAPKRAALGFIHRLEPVARGAYTGAAGYVRGDGRVVLNVAIRTAVVGRDTVDYHAGGGIVWESDAGAEWRETLTKSREMASFDAARAEAARG